MRSKLLLTILTVLALSLLVGAFVPRAAQAAKTAHDPMIVGTLVATPQGPLPTTLLLQVGGQTLPITVTLTTRVVRRYGQAAALYELRDGDSLQVTGSPNQQGGITATWVEDLTLPVNPPPTEYQAQGTLAAPPNPAQAPAVLCLAKVTITSLAFSPNVATVSPCPDGQLPVAVTTSTRYARSDNSGASLAELNAGDLLQATGTFVDGRFTATRVKDLSLSAVYVVRGRLAALPGQTSAPVILCLANASITGGGIRSNVATVSPCPSGQLPVAVTAGTRIVRANYLPASLADLRINDRLEAIGNFIGTQFTATRIRDLSLQAATIGVEGTIGYISFATDPTYFTLRVTRDPSGKLPIGSVVTVYVQASTVIEIGGVVTSGVSQLNPGQVASVRGVYDAVGQRFVLTTHVYARNR